MPKLIFADSKNSDFFYATKAHVSDPTFFLDAGNKKYIFLDHREIGMLEQSNVDQKIEAVLVNPFFEEVQKNSDKTNAASKLALLLLEKYGLKNSEIEVPASFPLDMADYLREKGINLICKNPFYPERSQKNPEEINFIRKSLQNTYPAFQKIEEILEQSQIQGDEIIYNGKVLTSEMLKAEAEKVLLEHGMLDVEGMIISSDEHSVIPHHRGEGKIKPHKALICDIFPRHRESGYFADMTRTYVKGKPDKKLRENYDAVLRAQEAAMNHVRPGVLGKDVHAITCKIFSDDNHKIGEEGFVHGTGHGLGIDIHEAPYANAAGLSILEPGNIFTVEPGLYYSGLGGIRIEDVVLVTEAGFENLTNFPKRFIIS